MLSNQFYSQDQLILVEKHIESYYGNVEYVFHEKFSPDFHLDVCLIPPDKRRNYITLCTFGMGSQRMNVPEFLKAEKLTRAEIMICLPNNWNLSSFIDEQTDKFNENYYWPIRLLKRLARLPFTTNSWLGFGHTIDFDEPFAPNNKFSGALIVGAMQIEGNKDAQVCRLADGGEINFYQVLPLFANEVKLCQEVGARNMLNYFARFNCSPIVDINRINVCDVLGKFDELKVQVNKNIVADDYDMGVNNPPEHEASWFQLQNYERPKRYEIDDKDILQSSRTMSEEQEANALAQARAIKANNNN